MNKINYDWSLLGIIHLDLGSGDAGKQRGGNVSLDIRDCGTDIVWDIRKGGIPLPDDSCAKITASHIMEHFYPDEFIRIMNECWRILKNDGELYIITPSFERNARTANHHLFPTEETFRGFEPTENYTLGWDNYGQPVYRWTIKEIILNERKDYHCKMTPYGKI